MKKNVVYPVLFFIAGTFLIYIVCSLSISSYLKGKGSLSIPSIKNISDISKIQENVNDISELKTDENYKIFFEKPKQFPKMTNIKIFKSKRILELYGDDRLIGRFKIGLGKEPDGDKSVEGDNKTPEGCYYICSKNTDLKYTYFLGISYPNVKDARKGLNSGLINQLTFNRIKYLIENKRMPPWDTPLGGAVGIHGGGNEYNWTFGCIALSNDDINIIKDYTPMNTPVEIFK